MPTRTIENYERYEPLEATKPELAVSVPATVAAAHIVKRGDVIGITSTNFARRRTRTVTTGAGFATNSNIGAVEDGNIFVAGDEIRKLDGTVIGTVLAVTAVTIVLTANASVAVPAGQAIIAAGGAHTAKGLAGKTTNGTVETTIDVYIAGIFDESRLRGLDASAKQELGGASVAGGIFKL